MTEKAFRFIPRRRWTSEPPGGTAFDKPRKYLFLHHTAGPMPEGGRRATRGTEEALIRATRAFHVGSRGMSDIAYNVGVMPSGRAYILRGFRSGGHTLGYNETGLAIVGFGNFQTAKVSDPMRRAVRLSRKRMRKKRWLRRLYRFLGHRDVGLTACPGNNLYVLTGKK